MQVTSGKICVGLSTEIAESAASQAMDFEQAAICMSNHRGCYSTKFVAKNGTWKAYKKKKKEQEYCVGWFICHSDTIQDPVYELRQMIYNTFSSENGGDDPKDGCGTTLSHHEELGYAILERGINHWKSTWVSGRRSSATACG
ncbi:unnamed protein product [Cylindrotheca closterium]|uniref:Uncharacterized protein n=1 Tax=Cylindrotheca closterium TaxID=2856 RepID=A0AAD2FIF8_9STRA|nr:unnamed protein product [Cylindrotheca closterium]